MDELAGNEKDPGVVKLEGGGTLALLLVKISTRGRSPRDSKPKKTGPTAGPRKYAVIVRIKHWTDTLKSHHSTAEEKHEQEELVRKGKKALVFGRSVTKFYVYWI
jgi:hypothetical protein